MVLIEKALERVFPTDVRARHRIMEAAREGLHTILGKDTHSAEQPSWNQLRTVIDRKAIKVTLGKPGTVSA